MRVSIRTNCVICAEVEFLEGITLQQFPIYMGISDSDVASDVYYDQIWMICAQCGCIQLTRLVDLNSLYSVNHNAVVGKIWEDHHREFAEFIWHDSPQKVCEIGAAHGFLSEILHRKGAVEYRVIEPSPSPMPSNVEVYQAYFEDRPELIEGFTAIVHSHVLEHVYKPREFLSEIYEKMNDNAIMYVSFPNMEALIDQKGANSLNFEHTYLLQSSQFEWLLNKIGFSVLRKSLFQDHSFFYACGKLRPVLKLNVDRAPNVAALSHSFIEMIEALNQYALVCQTAIEEFSGAVYLFGAHIFSQILLNLGIEEKSIQGILDNSPGKIGHRLYGTNLQVYSPEIISNSESPIVILLASHYQAEIRDQLTSINSKVLILE